MGYKSFIFNLIICWCGGQLFAQKLPVHQSNAQWFQYYTQVKVHPRWSWNSDGSLRSSHAFRDWATQLVRTGMAYQKGPWQTYTSLAYFWSYSGGNLSQREWRWSQDLSYMISWPSWSLNQRVRIENRFIDPFKGEKFKVWRYRYRLQGLIPVYTGKNDLKVNIVLTEEVLMHRATLHSPFIESNRLQAGLQWQVHKNWQITGQYMLNHTKRLDPDQRDQTHILWLSILQRFSIQKSKT